MYIYLYIYTLFLKIKSVSIETQCGVISPRWKCVRWPYIVATTPLSGSGGTRGIRLWLRPRLNATKKKDEKANSFQISLKRRLSAYFSAANVPALQIICVFYSGRARYEARCHGDVFIPGIPCRKCRDPPHQASLPPPSALRLLCYT